MVTESTETFPDNKIEAPAITICPQNRESNYGWKNSSETMRNTDMDSFYEIFCSELEGEPLLQCIADNT